jgi:hypothetical protein
VVYGQTVGVNYSWLAVSGLDPGPADLDADGENDYYLSFEVPFFDLVTQVNALGLPGFAGLTDGTPVQYVAGSSTNSKSVNQDWSGPDGDATWGQAWSTANGLSSILAVPEPGTASLLALGLAALGVWQRRRAWSLRSPG